MAATTPKAQTWESGFAQLTEKPTWESEDHYQTETGEKASYAKPTFEEVASSTVRSSLGENIVRTWPSVYNGTDTPNDLPDWWSPDSEVDVLICGGRFAAGEEMITRD